MRTLLAADLDRLGYFPALRSRAAELRGYRELRDETKEAICPIVSIGRIGKIAEPNRVLERVTEIVGRCFLDVNTIPNQACDGFEKLCDPANDYSAWRSLAGSADRIVPVALLRDEGTARPFIRQALEIEKRYGIVAIRSRRPAHDLALLQAALAAVEDLNNVIIFLDLGYIRNSLDIREQEARHAITALRTTGPSVRIVVLASSFPKSVAAYGENGGTLEIIERDLHFRLGGDEVAIYGDHSSVFPEPFEPEISRFVPRIDYCLDAAWIYRRRRADDGGYEACARDIIRLPDWDAPFADRVWGARMIRDTAMFGPQPGLGAPANWIAARVNMHIERQQERAVRTADDAAGDDDDDTPAT